MVDIQAKEIIDKMSQDLKVQPAMQLPRELGKIIDPVFVVNPDRLIRSNNKDLSDGTAVTIFTTDPNKDTFITGVTLSVAKSVLSTSLFSLISASVFGQASNTPLLRIRFEPVTAGQFTESIIFKHPILLQRNTVVQIENNNATASIDMSAVVFFFEVDPQ